MIDRTLSLQTPGLLVSVRSAEEALIALDGGADVIDVKEPRLGSLGPAVHGVLVDVVRTVAGHAPVTAALGELMELVVSNQATGQVLPQGISLFKMGLAGAIQLPDWHDSWRTEIAKHRGNNAESDPQPVAVLYADWKAANAPPPADVLHAAIAAHCPALLVDTWDKQSGSLFEHWAWNELQEYVATVQCHGMKIVLAGSLDGDNFERAVQMSPTLVAVRGAACDAGRVGRICARRVRNLKQIISRFHVGRSVQASSPSATNV
jgi:uncharacterized protein (UPF0264 family)